MESRFTSPTLLLGAAVVLCVTATQAEAQSSQYALLDRHALSAPAYVEQSVDQLAAYLTRPARSDHEKVRVIFRWVADRIAYDVPSFLSGQYGDIRPEAVLYRRCAVCSGYTALFEALARRAGLETVTINGSARGIGYQAGSPNHAWNAVKLQGRWQLLDVTWAAGHVNNGQFVRHFKEHYFLTPPEQMILTHYPGESRWQLLQTPLTPQQFAALPHVDADLFEMGVTSDAVWSALRSPVFHGFVKMYAHDGPVKIIAAPLGAWLHSGREYTFIIDAPLAAQLALVNNGQFVPMQRRGRHFEAVVRPHGELKLAQQRHAADPQFQVILHYAVR